MFRRDFLTAASAASLVSLAGRAPSLLAAAAATASSTDRVVVVIQLTGGNDGLNMVVPYADDEYHRRRPTLHYTADQVHRLNDKIGLHPSMEKFAVLCREGKAAVVQGVGYPQPNRSHFESMDLWHSAHGTGAMRQTGWLGRWLDEKSESSRSHSLGAVHVGSDSLPHALWSRSQPAVSMQSLDSMRLPQLKDYGATIDRLLESKSGNGDTSLLQRVAEQSRIAVATSRSLSQAGQMGTARSDYPGGPLAERLHAIARMICADMPARVYYVTLDGFDTHASQQNAHAALLGQLSDSVAAFTEDLKSFGHEDRVRMMIFSEFGRRVQENASRGTDHGAAGPVLIVGDPSLPMVLGKQPNLHELDADGDLKFQIDYRRVYATVLGHWLSVESESLLGGHFDPLLA